MYTQVWDHMNHRVSDQTIMRDEDGAFIPFDDGNTDYQEYKRWLDAGNTPTPVTPPPAPESPPDPLPVPPAQAYQELLDLTERVEALETQMKAMRK